MTGVRKIILASVPDLSTLPIASTNSRSSKKHLASFSRELNSGLKTISSRCKSRVNIQVADIYSRYNEILANPQAYGFNSPEAKVACYSGSYHSLDGEICESPSERILYDSIHPSHATHRIIAQVFQAALEGF